MNKSLVAKTKYVDGKGYIIEMRGGHVCARLRDCARHISGKYEPRMPAAVVGQDNREPDTGYVGIKHGSDNLRVMCQVGKSFRDIAVLPVLLKCDHDDRDGIFNELQQDTLKEMMKDAGEDLLEHDRIATGTSPKEAMKMQWVMVKFI